MLEAITVTLKLAFTTTVILLLVATPLAWQLAMTRSRWRTLVEAVVGLPMILPPTVLGFYLLVVFSPDSWLGQLWWRVTGTTLSFSFSGLVLASVLYSLPFVVQPLQRAFEQFDTGLLEAAQMMGAGAMDRFFNLVLPC